MDDSRRSESLPNDTHQLKALLIANVRQLAQREDLLAQRDAQLAQQQATIATLTKERDEFYIQNLKLQLRLEKALKQAFGPRADRISDAGQMYLEFGQKLEELPVRHGDVAPEENEAESTAEESPRPVSRRIRTRGRRDIGTLTHLPVVEQEYKLEGDLCRCPQCQQERKKIGEQVSVTIEHVPVSAVGQNRPPAVTSKPAMLSKA